MGEQIFPAQESKLVLGSSGGEACIFVACPVDLCSVAFDAEVGQGGRAEAAQMQVDDGGPRAAVLCVTKPQQRPYVFSARLNRPAFNIGAERLNSYHGVTGRAS